MTSGSSSSASAPPEASDGWLGRTLDGRYRVEALLGSGGVGVVYRAEHLALGRKVALKVLSSSFGPDDALRRRFEREARVLSALQHPNIVAVSDYGIVEGTPYLVMELLEGRTLASLLTERGALPPSLALRIARDMLRGLAFAHGRGVLHRDLKPANVFLQTLPDDPYHVKLLDFGLAKVLSQEEAVAEGDSTLTGSGVVLGTPTYMAPEQAAGDPADARADVYATGVVLFELLTGHPPFTGKLRMEVMRAHMTEPPPRLRELAPDLGAHEALQAFLDRALAKDRAERFADANDMLRALDTLPAIEDPAASSKRSRLPESQEPGTQSQVDAEAETVLAHSEPRSAAVSDGQRRLAVRHVRRWVGGGLLVLASLGGLSWFGASETSRKRAAGAPDARNEREDPKPARLAEASAASRGRQPAARTEAPRATVEHPAPVAPKEPPGPSTTSAASAEPRSLPPARDPIRRGPPRALRISYKKVVAGRLLSSRQHKRLRTWQRNHAEDVRASLLLARDFARRGWYADAVERYELAFRLDPSSRGSRWMQRDLIDIAASESRAAPRAFEALRRIYGPKAERMVRRAAARKLGEARRRLTALAERLASGS